MSPATKLKNVSSYPSFTKVINVCALSEGVSAIVEGVYQDNSLTGDRINSTDVCIQHIHEGAEQKSNDISVMETNINFESPDFILPDLEQHDKEHIKEIPLSQEIQSVKNLCGFKKGELYFFYYSS